MVEVRREIDRLVDAIAAVGHSDALASRLKEAEARQAALARTAAVKPIGKDVKVGDLMARYKRHLVDLDADLKAEPARARAALLDYFGEIKIAIDDRTDTVWAEFSADPARLLLKAVGDSNFGCGGALWQLEPQCILLPWAKF